MCMDEFTRISFSFFFFFFFSSHFFILNIIEEHNVEKEILCSSLPFLFFFIFCRIYLENKDFRQEFEQFVWSDLSSSSSSLLFSYRREKKNNWEIFSAIGYASKNLMRKKDLTKRRSIDTLGQSLVTRRWNFLFALLCSFLYEKIDEQMQKATSISFVLLEQF